MANDLDSTFESAQREAQRQAYIEAIQRAEEEARLDPAGHRRKVVLFSMFGYFFLFVPLALLLAVTVGLGWIGINANSYGGWPLFGAAVSGIFAYGWFMSLWVRLPPPEGVPIRRSDAPGLFEIIDSIRDKAPLPRLSAVYLTPDANASLYTRPMILGLFGPGRQTLILGIVLLAGINADHTRALIAHEFSHQRKDDARAATWGNRVRVAWSGLAQRGNILVNPILNWFAPRLDAMTFANAREAEYDADAFAASMTDLQTAGEALMRLTLVGLYFETVVVPQLHESIGRTASPPGDFYSAVISRMRKGEVDTEGSQPFARALRDKTSYEDTHPCLLDRLIGIGYHQAQTTSDPLSLVSPPQPTDDALTRLFETITIDRVLDLFDRQFAMMFAEAWASRHAMVTKSKAALGGSGVAAAHAVAESHIGHCTDSEALMETAAMVIETRSILDAMPWIERVLALEPDHAHANSLVARELLDADDPAGIDYAKRATANDPRAYLMIANSLYTYYRGQGMVDEAEQLTRQLAVVEEKLHHATVERTSLASAKCVEAHDLSEMEVQRLREDLEGHPRVLLAHVFRMSKLKHLSEVPGYVLAIKFKQRSFTVSGQNDFVKLAEQISESLRSNHWIIVYTPSVSAWLRRPCRKHPEAEVFRRQ
jgi:Zn-dependent protease with chaperone function